MPAPTANGGAQPTAPPHLPYASRLKTARALALDVWTIFSAANLPPDCINLGQGYMNFAPPTWIRNAATEAMSTASANHYSQPRGRIRLREALRDYYSADFRRTLDVNKEIIVTSGATEGQYAAFTAFVEHGNEVIMFEPCFDQYLAAVTFNGGVPIHVPLHPPKGKSRMTSHDWKIDFNELRNAITPRTKMILVNTPHNPLGKVFTLEELEGIAALAEEFNLIVMADEVYDCIVFDDKKHVRIASLPGMWNRTITVGSAGKSFACTGWRVGWLVGPASLIGPTLAAKSRIVYSTSSPLQEATATGFEKAREHKFFETQVKEYEERRSVLLKYFEEIGLPYTIPEGSYYVLVDISRIQIPKDYPFPDEILGRGRDFKAGWFIAQEIGVSAIPISEFYCDEHTSIGERFLRFAFCKDIETLHKAGEKLRAISKYLPTLCKL